MGLAKDRSCGSGNDPDSTTEHVAPDAFVRGCAKRATTAAWNQEDPQSVMPPTPLATLRRDGRMRPPLHKQKPPAFWLTADSLELTALLFVQQHAFCLFRIDRTVEKLVVFEEDLDERGARGNRSLDQRLGQRIFNVFL